jgi:hypothetical protein
MTGVEVDSKLRQLGVVQSARITSATALPFSGVETAVTIAVVSFVLTSFSRALIGKAADLSWDIEVVAEYETWKMASSDAKNYRYYVALATGFAKARLPSSRVAVDFLDVLPADFTTRPRGLKLSRRSD